MRTRIFVLSAGVLAGLCAVPAGLAGATSSPANTIYWGENSGGRISQANLDGSGNGSNLSTGLASVSDPNGLAIDSATGTIYWVNAGNSTIGEAKLDGSGGANLSLSGSATLDTPTSIAIDPAANKIFWVNQNGGTGNTGAVSEANLDGTSAKDMNTGTATVSYPQGLAIDPSDNRIYWTNTGTNTISYANLDDTGGGGNLTITGVASAVNNPVGLAIDPSAGRIYWADAVTSGHISSANLDGSGSKDIVTTGASAVDVPAGVAIDPGANRIYWADKATGKISEANLDGTGDGSDLSMSGASVSSPYFVAILKAPVAAGAPQISGSETVGSTLSCSQGTWEQDLLSGFLYEAPHTYSYQWTLNGTSIAGATSSTEVTQSGGSYSCQVTAMNQAGSDTQSSATLAVVAAAGSAPPSQTITPAPVLTNVKQKHRRWRESNRQPTIASARAPLGTTFQFAVNEAASVSFAFQQRVHGRTATRGTLTFHAAAGNRTVRFGGRISKRSKLRPGSYSLLITATANGKSATRTLKFTIAKG